jgi:hypothetical protein
MVAPPCVQGWKALEKKPVDAKWRTTGAGGQGGCEEPLPKRTLHHHAFTMVSICHISLHWQSQLNVTSLAGKRSWWSCGYGNLEPVPRMQFMHCRAVTTSLLFHQTQRAAGTPRKLLQRLRDARVQDNSSMHGLHPCHIHQFMNCINGTSAATLTASHSPDVLGENSIVDP